MPVRTAEEYSERYLEVDRPQPLTDKKIESLIQDVLRGSIKKDITDQVYIDFQEYFKNWLASSKLNKLEGLESFLRSDICIGCTQFIDTIYMKGPVQTLKGDYRYHQRLNPDISYSVPGYLLPNIPLIIALPFPSIGSEHPNLEEILNECERKNIEVHIDGAWITCSRFINFNFDHPAVVSVALSLSKGLGLGWNRIALRWTKSTVPDAITIMNDFHMNNRVPAMIANHFLSNLEADHLWKTHAARYDKICKDFDLVPTKSIHLALRDGQPVGVSSLIRYLENADIS
jgi:hypothetical protein